MEETTMHTSRVSELLRLSREAGGIYAQLESFMTKLQQSGVKPPAGIRESLQQFNAMIITLGESIVKIEGELRSLQELAKIGYVINSSLDLATVLNQVMDTIIHLTGAERAFLMLCDDPDDMEIVIARNWEHETLDQDEQGISRTVVNRVVQNGEALLTTNAKDDPRFDAISSIVAYNLRSILCVPLKAKDKLMGVIYVDNRIKEGSFSEKDKSILFSFANQAAVALENAQLFSELSIAYDQTLEALMTALETRDHETEGHTRRVMLYCSALAESLGLPEDLLLDLQRGAMMHDIGKLGVPDAILLKPGPLSEKERAIMRRHAEYGLRMLDSIMFLQGAVGVIGSHHEHYDGTGYPRGLEGEEISIGARIFAVADTFDAITSDRPYRKAQTYAQAREEIISGRGGQFDPEVVDAFLAIPAYEWDELRSLTLPRSKPDTDNDSS